MICLKRYRLIEDKENEKLYKIQQKLIHAYNTTGDIDYLINISLLMTASPVCDYYQAISILYDCVLEEDNYYAYVIGSYLSSTWLNFKTNKFLEIIKNKKEINSIIEDDLMYYLFSYDIYMKSKYGWEEQCKKLLRKSIENSKMVNNFLLLSQLEENETKELSRKAKENSSINLQVKKKDDYDWVYEPHIYIERVIIGKNI